MTLPTFTRGDRLRKARELTGLSQDEFARQLEVSRSTITNYERDRSTRVRPIMLRAWSVATGVSVEWLETGEVDQPSPVE
jgi:transcriptional regulator with XRE-family HTH domain